MSVREHKGTEMAKITKEIIEKMKQRYLSSNLTQHEVALEFGIHPQTINSGGYLKGLRGRPKGDRKRWEEMKAMKEEGFTLEEIGEHFDISREAVRQAINKLDKGL